MICLSCGTNLPNITKSPLVQDCTFSVLSALSGLLSFLYIQLRVDSLGPRSQRCHIDMAQYHVDARTGPNPSHRVLPTKLSYLCIGLDSRLQKGVL